jgi:hypothetical protein
MIPSFSMPMGAFGILLKRDRELVTRKRNSL